MMNSTISQDLTDAATSMEMAQDAAKRGDNAMMTTALKDLRTRANRILKALSTASPGNGIDPQLPTEPRLPIREGEA